MSRGMRSSVLILGVALACSRSQAGTLPTSTPSETAPASTPATSAASPGDFGVGDAVRTYYAALEAAVHDPARNTDALASAIDPACGCYQVVSVLRDEAKRGRHADYALNVTRLSVPNATATAGTAFVTVRHTAGNLYDANGRVVEAIRATTESLIVEVRMTRGRWIVTRVAAR